MQTVQTSWRPQLPLPKELTPAGSYSDMDKSSIGKHGQNNSHHHNSNASLTNSQQQQQNNKKWSLGGLFRRKKKDNASDSSTDDDQKAGFNSKKRKSKSKLKRTSKLVDVFDHIVINPVERPAPTSVYNRSDDKYIDRIATPESNRSTGSFDRRLRRERIRAARVYSKEPVSSEEDTKSYNSSSISRFRSDESLANSGSSSKRTRAARTERYMKRISKGDDQQVPSRWQTQPINPTYAWEQNNSTFTEQYRSAPAPQPGLRSSASLTNVPSHKPNQPWNVPMRLKYPEPAASDRRSVSYENHIHRMDPHREVVPPPPPPRDPQRRLTLNMPVESRPVSYAFDKVPHHQHIITDTGSINSIDGHRIGSRCVSDDRLWGHNAPIVPQRPSSVQPAVIAPTTRRFITRQDPEYAKNVKNSQPEYRYVADAAPRSRRPIHVISDELKQPEPKTSPIRTTKNGLPSSPMKSAADFWKKIDQAESCKRTPSAVSSNSELYRPTVMKPRSLSHSRIQYPTKMSTFSTEPSIDQTDNVVSGNLYLKPSKSCIFQLKTPPVIQQKQYNPFEFTNAKTHSMPSYYVAKTEQPAAPVLLNKYEEHVAKHISEPFKYKPKPPPAPPMRCLSKTKSVSDEEINHVQRKSTNLEDAINELEAIYKSLRLGDEDLLERADRKDIPTPTRFNQQFINPEQYVEDDDDDDSKDNGEPDIVLDDVVYRNLKRANNLPKTVDNQPPFGIPIGPIPPSPGTDYLHVSPNATTKPMFVAQKCPDPVSDDLAVRNLRKDAATAKSDRSKTIDHFVQPSSKKKNRAVRSMSENIYNLIQRDAAKPSGGCLDDYSVLERSLANAGSLNKLNSDHPSTLFMLQRERELMNKGDNSTKRGGAVFNLPSTLKSSPAKGLSISNRLPSAKQKSPMPLPRTVSISPDIKQSTQGMEDILNAIAKEAQESSAKLTRDLQELRSEPKASNYNVKSNSKLEADIENVSHEAKKYEHILEDVVGDCGEVSNVAIGEVRHCRREKKLLKDINDVAEAAKVLENVVRRKSEASLDATSSVVRFRSISTSPVREIAKGPLPVEQVGPMMVAVTVSPPSSPKTAHELVQRKSSNQNMEDISSVAKLLEKLEPESKKIGAIAERCMRQLTELGDLHIEIAGKQTKPFAHGDYDNINHDLIKEDNQFDRLFGNTAFDDATIVQEKKTSVQEEIDKIMKECAEEAVKTLPKTVADSKFVSSEEELNIILLPPSHSTPTHLYDDKATSLSSPMDDQQNNKSSSDCLKSSSATPNRHHSSSITSFNAQSSSDFVKSLSSSDYRLASDDIKTNSTTSCDVKSSSMTTGCYKSTTASPFTPSPSPPLALTPQTGDDQSQYNSTEELAMIFGIGGHTTGGTNTTGNDDAQCDATNKLPKHGHDNKTLDSPQQQHQQPWEYVTAFDNLDTIFETHEESCIDEYDFASSLSININQPQNDSNFSSLASEESNPDSGNVSLNEFPMSAAPVVELFVPSALTTEQYPFISEIQISSPKLDRCLSLESPTFNGTNNSNFKNEVSFETGSVDAIEIPEQSDSSEISLVAVNESSSDKDTFTSQPSSSLNAIDDNQRFESLGTSSSSSSLVTVADADEFNFKNCNNSVVNQSNRNELIPRTRNCRASISKSTPEPKSMSFIQPHHLFLACTYGLANTDLLTLTAIIIAIITIIALMLL